MMFIFLLICIDLKLLVYFILARIYLADNRSQYLILKGVSVGKTKNKNLPPRFINHNVEAMILKKVKTVAYFERMADDLLPTINISSKPIKEPVEQTLQNPNLHTDNY